MYTKFSYSTVQASPAPDRLAVQTLDTREPSGWGDEIAFLDIDKCRHHELGVWETHEEGIIACNVTSHSKGTLRQHLEHCAAKAPE